MGNVSASVGHVAHRDLGVATKRALADMEGGLSGDPEFVIFITGNYPKGKKSHKEALKVLEASLGRDIPMLGMTGMATFTATDYSVRGAAVMGLQGVDIDPIRTPRICVRSKQKGQKIAKYFKSKAAPTEKSASVHFPKGLIFPGIMMNKLSSLKPSKLFAGFNLPTIYWFSGLMRRVGKLSSKMMNLSGIGMPYTGVYNAFEEMNKAGLQYIGSGGGNIFTSAYSYQFYNYRLFQKAMVSFQMRSKTLKFGTGLACAANMTDKEVNIQDYIPGGFLVKINGKWGRDAVFELNDVQDPQIYYKHAQEVLYFDSAHPLCLVDPDLDEGDVRVYALGANPHLRAAMHSAPDHIMERLRKKKIKAVMGYQTGKQIIESVPVSLQKTLEEADILQPKFGFVFDCVNCMMALGHRFEAIPKRIRDVLGDTPFLGVGAGGEFISLPNPVANMSMVSLLAGS
ncbi:MAG: hypothetical protein ACXACI_15935 [Candidatus Hodarchaeales archaeon]|jgi:hypothetical protein